MWLIKQIDATGREKADGYHPRIMEEIYDWERNEVEDIVWNTFYKNKDFDLAEFFPKLKNHDGIDALRKALPECKVPSHNSVTVAKVLYDCTRGKKYLDVLKANIEKDKDDISFVAILAHCKPGEDVYRLLADIYINTDDDTIRSVSAIGILYNKGFINDPLNLKEKMNKIELRRMFMKDGKEERKDMINRLEAGEFDK
jgi:hypothetical protein